MTKITTYSEKETEAAGASLAEGLAPGAVVALYGGLGAGKTAFARGIASGLGVKARVTSPTFTICNEYEGRCPLFHFDMYRLSGAEELFGIGWQDYLARGGICVLEWSERVGDALTGGEISVHIGRISENGREITITEGNDADFGL